MEVRVLQHFISKQKELLHNQLSDRATAPLLLEVSLVMTATFD
ncbi:hypothetical protein [Virgibacillus dokdonensis]